jgi:beta-lactamase class A
VLKLVGAGLTVLVLLLLSGLFVLVAFPGELPLALVGGRAAPSSSPVAVVTASPSQLPSPSPTPSPIPVSRTPALQKLNTDLSKIAVAGAAKVSVSLVELAGSAPISLWSIKGDASWPADSTYKLPLLMAEAQGIAAGKFKATDQLCYKSSDYEVGWYDDYAPGKCYTRAVLAQRIGHFSDNTAAHILVRYLGGSVALNAFARSMGAVQSRFWLPNTTSTSDLARLWWYEAVGAAGGTAAQSWLYPLITKTYWEAGIPAGTPKATVVHKVGYNGRSLNDAALVVNGPKGAYILTICTNGPGGAAGWQVIAQMATRVYQFEVARPA